MISNNNGLFKENNYDGIKKCLVFAKRSSNAVLVFSLHANDTLRHKLNELNIPVMEMNLPPTKMTIVD